jgi:ribosomal protein S18 acetylase RimI-like enzyme
MRRHNPLRLSDKEDDFLKELLELVAVSAGKEKESDLDELLEFYTFKDKDIQDPPVYRTGFVLEWTVKDKPTCKIELDFSPIHEIYAYDSYRIQSETIAKIYSDYGVLLERGWIPNVDGFYIESLKVDPSCRGEGWGLNVLKLLMELADRHGVYLTWDYDSDVKGSEDVGSNAIENLKAWYQKAGGLFSPIAHSIDFYDFVYPDYILKPYKGLASSPEPITRLNPGEVVGTIIPGFLDTWWYTGDDAKIMFQAMQSQFNDPDNHKGGEFVPDIESLRELQNSLAEQCLIDTLEKHGNKMVGMSSDWGSIAYDVLGGILIQEEELDEMPWSLIKFTGEVDPDTDLPEYIVVKTESAEHYLKKLMPKKYAEFLEDHGEEPLPFPSRSNPKVAKKVIRDSKGRKIPQKYLARYKGKKLTQRKKEIEQRRDEYQKALDKYGDEDNFPRATLQKLYRPFKTDKGVKSKRSSYTVEAKKRGFTGSIANKAKQASKYYGGKVSQAVLKEVNARGMAAWASGGHRPGQTSHSWGIARVNSFLVGGKTFFTSDKDLASKLPKKVQTAIKKKRHWKG